MGRNTSHPCPSCGNKTLAKRGMDLPAKPTSATTWLSCINCDWGEYEDDK